MTRRTVATFHDDVAWLDRLTTMMKMTFPILLAITLGCASDVELPLDLDRGAQPPPEMEPDPSSDPPLADEWSRTDFPTQGWIQDLVWTTDGAVVAATPIAADLDAPTQGAAVTLTRYGADGAIEWVAHASPTDLFMNLAAIEGGGVLVATRPDLYGNRSPQPAGLAWYDADGNLTASWRPSDEVTGDQLVAITSFEPLPDGGVFWVGVAGLSETVPVAGLLDAERQLQWIVPLPAPAESEVGEPTDVALTADGGLVVLAGYRPEGSEPSTSSDAYVVQLGPDGGERWRTELVGSGAGAGMRVASSGNLVVAGTFRGRVSVGDLVLEDEPYPPRHFVAEIDPAGEARGVHRIELPAWLVGAENRFRVHAMTMTGEDLVVAGDYFTDPLVPAGFLATTHRVDGTFVSERIFALQEVVGGAGSIGPMAVGAAPDGRLAAGGAFSGSVDFGDGVVDSGVGENGYPLTRPFVAVFEPGGTDVD